MKRILVLGSGGVPATNFVRSLRKSKEKYKIIGAEANKYYVLRSETDITYLIPFAKQKNYIPKLNKLIKKERIDFLHAQNDSEIAVISENREKIHTKLFLPGKETVKICQNKFYTYEKWKKAKIKIPKTKLLNNYSDLKNAFELFNGKVWLRAVTGAAGKGSLPVFDLKTAKYWIEFNNGWGSFTAAEMLTDKSVTWMSLWKNGELIVAQGRKRLYWEMGKVSPSGITGVTGGGQTVSDKKLDIIAEKSILSIDKTPNGLYGVDLTYDAKGTPNPTEINIGRFFTTNLFFTEAGLNMPELYVKAAYDEKLPTIKKINPLQKDLLWIRGMDFLPILSSNEKLKKIKIV